MGSFVKVLLYLLFFPVFMVILTWTAVDLFLWLVIRFATLARKYIVLILLTTGLLFALRREPVRSMERDMWLTVASQWPSLVASMSSLPEKWNPHDFHLVEAFFAHLPMQIRAILSGNV